MIQTQLLIKKCFKKHVDIFASGRLIGKCYLEMKYTIAISVYEIRTNMLLLHYTFQQK